jgi:hypothetical protein
VVEEVSKSDDWDEFREKLINAKTKNKMGKEGKGPRYAVYDFAYDLASGEGLRLETSNFTAGRTTAHRYLETRLPSLHGRRMMLVSR